MTMKKAVIKVEVPCDKCRSKAMGVASQFGVDTMSFEGEYRDRLVVIGVGFDPINLAMSLKRELGYAEVIEVGDYTIPPPPEKKKEVEKKPVDCSDCCSCSDCCRQPIQPPYYQPNCPPCVIIHDNISGSDCTIM